MDDFHDGGAGVTQVSMRVKSSAPKPPAEMTVRYYFNVSEVANFNLIKSRILFDQVLTETAGAHQATLSDPIRWDKDPNIAYVEASWGDYNFVNCGKKFQFEVGFYYGDKWDPTNDPSYQEMKIYKSNSAFHSLDPPEKRNDYICIYDGGVLIGGIEPDGTKPVTDTPADPKTDEPEGTTTPAPTPTGKTVKGDVDESGEVDVMDVVLLARYLSEDGEAVISTQGKLNAECDGNPSLAFDDATAILKHIAKLELFK